MCTVYWRQIKICLVYKCVLGIEYEYLENIFENQVRDAELSSCSSQSILLWQIKVESKLTEIAVQKI